MILITGANGNLGSQTIHRLLKLNPSEPIEGLVRSYEKGSALRGEGIKIRIGDYNDPDSLEKAMGGVKTLLLVSASSLENRVQQHQNVIDAALSHGVGHLFYTGILHADKELSPLARDHHETEIRIKNSGLTYTIYRNTFYGEFLPVFLGNALETGQWYFPSGGEKINLALRSEMAEALANGLSDPDKHANQTYEITSNRAYSLSEIAELTSKETGKEITYHDIDPDAFKKTLKETGLPDHAITMSMAVADTFVNGALNFTHDDLQHLLGRTPADIPAFLPKVWNR